MHIDVGACIADLLYENDSVAIPGLGSFIAAYQPAGIDQLQRKMHPPGKTLTFNVNLVVNDGLLVNYVREKSELTLPEAQEAVDNFARSVRQAVDRREVVVFPKVGRLYQDFEQKLQFLPDETNFNADSYGLPVVEFFPILTGPAGKAAPDGDQPVLSAAGKDWSEVVATWFQRWLPWIGALTVILVIIGMVIYLRNDQPVSPQAGKEEIPSERINVKPSLGETPAAGAEGTPPQTAGENPQSQAEPEPGTLTPPDTEGSTIRPGQKYAVILIGLFGNQNNITKLTEKIYKAGFEPFTEPAGNLTRVGVIVPYDKEADVEEALEDVRNKFDDRAFVFRRGVEK